MPWRLRECLPGLLVAVTMAGILSSASLPCAARGEDRTTENVLILHGNQRATPAQVIIDDTLRAQLSATSDRPVQVFSEYLDDEWTSLETYGARQAEFLREKYELRRIRVIIADAIPALEFLRKFRDQIAVGVPVVYLAVAEDRVDTATLPPAFIGILENNDPAPTLALALRLHPGTRRFVLISGGTGFARLWEPRMRDAVARIGGDIDVQYMIGLRHEDVLRQVRAFDPGTVIFTPGYFNDGAGQVFTPRQSVADIAAASPVPVYGTFDTQIGTSILGGYMTSYQQEAKETAEVVINLLKGAAPAQLKTRTATRFPNVDWREVRRFHVDQSLLPPDTIVHFREPSPWEKYWLEIAIGLAIVFLQATLIFALLLQRSRRRTAEEASTALAWRLLTAHEDERRRLARDLHDDVTQRLARLAIDASGLERSAAGSEGKSAARGVRDDLVRLSEDVHALSYQLHPSVLDDLGLAEGIRAECARVSRQESVAVDVEVSGVPGKVAREPSLCLFRIAQEALRNVVRHAHAKAVSVSLVSERGGLKLTVRDDGQGFDAAGEERNPSLGQISMRERARQVGGTLRVVSAPGRGTTVTAWVPIEAPA